MRAFPLLIGAIASISNAIASGSSEASGTVCDCNGLPLILVRAGSAGSVQSEYPLKALGAQLLSDLSPTALPRNGEKVFLTIDARIQAIVEETLRKVGRASAVVINAENGDILAMASVPSFDPNDPDRKKLEQDPTLPLRNRALHASSPGATFLMVTALAGLAAGNRDFAHDCSGSTILGDRVMNCWIGDKGRGHGQETLREGFKNSCNTFFYTYGIAAGQERLSDMARLLGLGRTSGIPVGDEAPGLVPGPAELKKMSPREAWTDGCTANAAIGAGLVQATPLQMTSVAATIGNGGTVHQLRLVDRVVRRDGNDFRPERKILARLSEEGVSADDLQILRSAMESSVNESGGNARKGDAPGFRVGGRTGTAQIWRSGTKDSITAFVCFAKSEKATFGVGVFVFGAKSGGGVAAPLAARILTGIADPESHNDPMPFEAAAGGFHFVEAID